MYHFGPHKADYSSGSINYGNCFFFFVMFCVLISPKADFILELFGSLRYFMCGASKQQIAAADSQRVDFGQAFGVSHRSRGTNGKV